MVARLVDEYRLGVPHSAVRDYLAWRRPEIAAECRAEPTAAAESAIKAANHTDREVELMLAGKKPLAFSCDEIGCLPNEKIIPAGRFRPCVGSGVLVRDEVPHEGGCLPQLSRNAVVKWVFLAIKEGAWRIPAFRLSQRVFHRTGQRESGTRSAMPSPARPRGGGTSRPRSAIPPRTPGTAASPQNGTRLRSIAWIIDADD